LRWSTGCLSANVRAVAASSSISTILRPNVAGFCRGRAPWWNAGRRAGAADRIAANRGNDEPSAVNLAERRELYRKSGWQCFDLNAVPYTADQVRSERALHAH
jgi:hypothetical protein